MVDLLRQRADLAVEVGRIKREQGLDFYAPGRERQILERIAAHDLGAFPTDSVRIVFREIMAACLALQKRLRIAFLGPSGTFTEIAARQMFGQAADFMPQPDFRSVFDTVRGKDADFGLVPVENSTAGTIREVLDLLAAAKLTIVGETYYDVHHCLLSQATDLSHIEVVYSKDTALEQCKIWLLAHLPHVVQEAVSSTAEGAQLAAGRPTAAAIAPELAADVYDLPVMAYNIEDRSDNRTRFFALGQTMPKPSGQDKTSLLLSVPHRPGALVSALEVLQAHGLNMTLIESRPSPNTAFEYVFYIDIEGHSETAAVQAAIADLRTVCLLVLVLGSYPRAL